MFSFYKYHGLGNDFIIIDNRKGQIKLGFNTIVKMCDRSFGIGADGIVLVEESHKADIKMKIFNSDGSKPDMCGNAVRCLGKFVYDRGIVRSSTVNVETAAGIMKLELLIRDNQVQSIRVNMGRPVFEYHAIPCTIEKTPVIGHEIAIEEDKLHITSLLMGVPHTVVFSEDISDKYVMTKGKLIENLYCFPEKTNVNFVQLTSRDEISVRTWERGAGYTFACGTGACASVVAGIINGKLDDRVLVHLRGGDLVIEWNKREEVFMEGPAEEVFLGNYTAIESRQQ
ncbi:MAG: diaminopimelate epimerase [Bacillota bacterium]